MDLYAMNVRVKEYFVQCVRYAESWSVQTKPITVSIRELLAYCQRSFQRMYLTINVNECNLEVELAGHSIILVPKNIVNNIIILTSSNIRAILPPCSRIKIPLFSIAISFPGSDSDCHLCSAHISKLIHPSTCQRKIKNPSRLTCYGKRRYVRCSGYK